MHYKFSPSSSKKWIYCEGSLALEASLNLPDSTNPSSELGTGVHEVGERSLINYLEFLRNYREPLEEFELKEPNWYLGVKMNGHVMTQECIDAVTIYYEYCRDLIEQNGAVNCWVEKTFVHPDCDELGGTSDFSSLDLITGIFEVVDYKNGTGEAVWAEKNSQAMIYGLLQYWNLPPKIRENIKKFRLTIIQPRHYLYKDNGGIDSWNISLEDLLHWEREILFPAIDRIRADLGPLKASDEACKWCKAWNNCDQRKSNIDHLKSMMEGKEVIVTPKDLTEIDELFNAHSDVVEGNTDRYYTVEEKDYSKKLLLMIDSRRKEILEFENTGVNPDKVDEYCRNEWVVNNEKSILDFIKKSKGYGMEVLLKGNGFAGRKVIQGLKNTSYVTDMDVEDLLRDVHKNFGITYLEIVKSPEVITVTELKALLKSKKIPKGEIDEYIEGITERLDGDLKMVTLDKKGDSVTNISQMANKIDYTKNVDVEEGDDEILIFE